MCPILMNSLRLPLIRVAVVIQTHDNKEPQGTIGTGLFVGSGQTLALGGPAFILVSYVVMTILVYFIVTAITEVATYLPVHGGTMSYYGYRYVSRSMKFAIGYLYWYALGILVPYEG
jgi:amino acid transporter